MARLTAHLKRQLAHEIAPLYGADPDLMSEEDLVEIGTVIEKCTRRAYAVAPTLTGSEPLHTVIARAEAAIVKSVDRPPSAEFGLALVKISDLRRLLTEIERTK